MFVSISLSLAVYLSTSPSPPPPLIPPHSPTTVAATTNIAPLMSLRLQLLLLQRVRFHVTSHITREATYWWAAHA
jgi:hypothetical protein